VTLLLVQPIDAATKDSEPLLQRVTATIEHLIDFVFPSRIWDETGDSLLFHAKIRALQQHPRRVDDPSKRKSYDISLTEVDYNSLLVLG